MSDDTFWQTKLHARLHDPAEKALVLLRDPAGHEGGTSEVLHRLLGFGRIDSETVDAGSADSPHRALFDHGVPRPIYDIVKRADWWAAAADRPQWPMQEITVPTRSGETKTFKVADWAQVRWTKKPVLIHPLTGAEYELRQPGRHRLRRHQVAQLRARAAPRPAQGRSRRLVPHAARLLALRPGSARSRGGGQDRRAVAPAAGRHPRAGPQHLGPPRPGFRVRRRLRRRWRRTARPPCSRFRSARSRASSTPRAAPPTCGPARTCWRAWPGRR